MKFQEAIHASDYNTTTLEYNGLYTTVDGSAMDGNYSISTGRQGMPPSQHETVNSLDAAIKLIEYAGLDSDEWVPIGEDGELQES